MMSICITQLYIYINNMQQVNYWYGVLGRSLPLGIYCLFYIISNTL